MGNRRLSALCAVVGLSAAACQSGDGLTSANQPDAPRPSFVIAGQADYEEFELCKYGSSATFDYTVTSRNNGSVTNASVTLNDGDCRVLAAVGGAGADVTVTENTSLLPKGFQFNRAEVTVLTSNAGSSTSTVNSTTVSDWISGSAGNTIPLRGVLAEYYNEAVAEGEGCTPGYWKQPHHFDSWPAPYQPNQLFSTYFEDAFPGMTLLEVLSQGGGKLIALGRHTVAALLNAASGNVAYPLTPTQVINEFNAVYPGTKYGPLKDRFEAFNEAGCPLN